MGNMQGDAVPQLSSELERSEGGRGRGKAGQGGTELIKLWDGDTAP